ncbi:VanZ family protein [Isoptericola sp. NEAU-Y5]|uniref:VanZ family protein n=1 Tax=Isoptericola luteus TaxID=2879484 RepID=A0ABS7ZGS9_9MICO|nr:VanZ family protein [Isoptericola sp. NEAU-Y5]MCA5894227.1 VanZ family protein [Isoptericola sp. NEAU-Y5]
MISTLLVAHPWLTPAAFALLVLVGPRLGRWLAGRPRVAWALCGVSLLPVLALTLVPVDRELFERCAVQWAFPTFGRVEMFANVVLFVPPVLLAAVALRRPWAAFLAGSAASALVELVQALVPAIGRSCDTGDWLSNTTGALVGAALAWVALRLAVRTRDGAGPAPQPGHAASAGSGRR